MKKLFVVLSLMMVLVIAPMAMADQLTVNRYSGYFTGSGGEFTLSGTDLDKFQPYYADSTKDENILHSIQSFCVERDEFVSTPGTYYFKVSDKAMAGGINTDAGDPLSIGAAWLYHKFQLGKGELYYDYTPGSGRAASAGALQDTIWWLEDEAGDPGNTNVFRNAVLAKFGDFNTAHANNNGTISVAVLNLYSYDLEGKIVLNQDMLVCVPEPASMLLLGSGLIGLAGFARRRFKK